MQGLSADHRHLVNSPYKRAAHGRSGPFGGVLGDKENAGAEARAAAAAAAAGGTLSLEIAGHPRGEACPGSYVQQQQQQKPHPQEPRRRQQQSSPTKLCVPRPQPSIFFAAGGPPAPPVLPLSPSISTTARSSNAGAVLDRAWGFSKGGGAGGGKSGATLRSRKVRVKTGASFSPASAMLRVPASRLKSAARKSPAESRTPAVQGRRGLFSDVDEEDLPSSSPTAGKGALVIAIPQPAAAAAAPTATAEPESPSVASGGLPKRSRSPTRSPTTVEPTLRPPFKCEDEVSREVEAKARRRSASRSWRNITTPSTPGAGIFSPGSKRWWKPHARGSGDEAGEGTPRLKIFAAAAAAAASVAAAAAGDNDEVALLSPSDHESGDLPARYFCFSPIPVTPLVLGFGGSGGGEVEDSLRSSVDSAWSIGSIDETTAREPASMREEDKISGSDPVARMLLCQSDGHAAGATASGGSSPGTCGGNTAAAATTEYGGLAEEAAASPIARGPASPR